MVILERFVDVSSLGQVPSSVLSFYQRNGGEIDARREPINFILLSVRLAVSRAVSGIRCITPPPRQLKLVTSISAARPALTHPCARQ
jgi:hypothetical protein